MVRGTFSGELNGNGHSISGLDAVLFEKMDGASVTDLTITGSNLTADTQKGALANEIRNSTVEKIRVKNPVIENDANQAGGLAGIRHFISRLSDGVKRCGILKGFRQEDCRG